LSLEEPWLKVTDAYVFRRRTLVDRGVDRIGKVYEVYSSQAGGRPEWALALRGCLEVRRRSRRL